MISMRDVKVCLLGDSGVGKTSVVQRFVWDSFRDGQEHTIGASFMSKTLTFGNSSFRFQIWDTAGQEKYRTLAPMYYRGAAAAIIVYDITSKESFSNVKSWVRELEQQGPRDIVLAIAGNKKDLQEDREVDGDEAANYAKEVGAVFTETSALTAENVNELFQDIVKKLPKESEPLDRSNGTSKGKVRLHKADNQKQKKCC